MPARARSGGAAASAKNVRVVDRDQGYDALRKRLEGLHGARVKVGVHAKQGAAQHKGDDAEPVTVLDVATWAEFGIGQPERSWLRAWYDSTNAKSRAEISRALKAVVAGKTDANAALNRLGARFAGEIQARIAQGIDPPNAPSTIAKKGSSTPLINTGQFRTSITWSVELGEGSGGISQAAE